MLGSRRVATLAVSLLIIGALSAIGIVGMHTIRKNAAVGIRAGSDERGAYVLEPHAVVTQEGVMARIHEQAERARRDGINYNPHVHLPDGRMVMVQDEQMARIAMGTMVVQQDDPGNPGNKPGWCIDGDHLPKDAPEGSETGCGCGSHCDETGKHEGDENKSCKRYCNRDKCMCGMCL